MKMKYLVIIFATIIIAARCRSVTPSNVGDVEKQSAACIHVHRSARIHRDTNQDASSSNRVEITDSRNSLILIDEKTLITTLKQLKELLTSYEENFAKLINFILELSKNKDNNEQEIQFLNRLTLLIEEITKDLSKVKNIHIQPDNDTWQAASNKSTMRNVYNVKNLINTIKEIDIIYQNGNITDEHIRIKRAAEGYKGVLSFTTSEERINDIFIDIQRQLLEIQKCLDKLCKKHHLTSTITSEVNSDNDISPISESNKVSII